MSFKDAKEAQRYIGFNNQERPKGDFYPTPRIAITSLLDREKFGEFVWEPACGKGDIAEVLKEYGYNVFATDLYDWGYGDNTGVDFSTFQMVSGTEIDAVITNPPFNVPRGISTKFAYKALEVTKETQGKVAFLQRIQFLEGKTRKPLFTEFPLSKVLVFSSRLPRMHRFDYEGEGNSSMMAFAWFVWDWQHEGPPTIEWI